MLRVAIAVLCLAACTRRTGCPEKGRCAARPDGSIDAPQLPDDERPLLGIHVTTDVPPELVAYKVMGGPWQEAAQTSPTSYTAWVYGSYMVAVQCADASGVYQTWMEARTLDDSPDITKICAVSTSVTPPPDHVVTGTMVQPGEITFADGYDASTTPSWTFHVPAPNGAFDLLAKSETAIAIRRGIAVSGDAALTPAIDLSQEGAALVGTSLSATNAMPGETLTANVNITNATLDYPSIYSGAAASALVAPESVLVATDQQLITLRANVGTRYRAFRKPFRVGEDPTVTLPAPVDVSLAIDAGQLVVSWNHLLPRFDLFEVYGSSSTSSTYSGLDLVISESFADRVNQVVLDTAIPGYDTAQGVDFSSMYARGMWIQDVEGDHYSAEWFDETPDGFTARTTPPRQLARDTWNPGTAGADPSRRRTPR